MADEAGASLVEVLVSVILMSLVGLGVLTGLMVSFKASVIHRSAANAEVVAHNYEAALRDAAYVPCALPADYQSPPGFVLPTGYSIVVTDVQGWSGDVNQAAFAPFGTGCNSIPIDPAADSSLQQVSYDVVKAPTGGTQGHTRHRSSLKYFDGTTVASDRIPANAVRCTIGGVDDVSDATIDQALPTTNTGTGTSLDVNKGTAGDNTNAAQSTLLKFNINAGSTTCIGANDTNPGGTLPALTANLVVQRAQLTLYNWRINGAPSCPVECTVVLDRPTAAWNEGTVTWNTAPSVTPGRVQFELSQSSGDYSPAFQKITSAGLTADVQSFYGSQSAGPIPNYGWRMTELCVTSTGCATQAPGFQFRSAEWKQTSQRPTLELILAPRTTTAVQLRNVGSGLCASLKDDRGGADNQSILGLSCNGKGYQGWINTANIKQFMSTATVDNVANRKCIDIYTIRPAGRDAAVVYTCNPAGVQQQLTFNPSNGTITAQQKMTSSGALVTQCLEVDRSTAPAGGTSPVGTKVFLNDCDGNVNQQWSVEPQQGAPPPPSSPVRFRNIKGNSCADIEAGRANRPPYWRDDSPGQDQLISRTEQFPCMGTTPVAGVQRTSQTWRFDGYDRIINGRDQTACLNAGDGNVNTLVTVDYCSNLTRQQWSVETVNGTNKRIRSILTGNCLEGGYDGHQMRVRVCDANNQRQWWAIESPSAPATAPIGWFRNEGSFNSCMEPQNGAAVSHQAAIWTWPCTSDHPQQEFIRYRVSDTQVQYRPTANLTLCLDTYGAGDGTNVHLYNCSVNDPGNASSSTNTQQWTLSPTRDLNLPPTPVDGVSRRIVAADSGRCEQAETDGALVVARACNVNNAYQRWFFEPVGDLHQEVIQLRSALRADSGCLAPSNKLQDLDGGFGGNDNLTTWPCSGALQPAQSFVRLTNGQIRLTSDVSFCVDSGHNASTNAPGTNAYARSGCHLGAQQTWRYVEVTGSNPTKQLIQTTSGNLCLSAGLDMVTVTMATCNLNAAAQQWYIQPFGTSVDSRVGHIRGIDTTNCLEQDQSGGLSNGRWVWAYPCSGDTRAQQRFVLLNNGQIRPLQDLAYCLDDSTGTITDRNGHMNINTCNTPVSNQQNWGRDVNGVRVAVIGAGNSAQGYPVGVLRNARMAAAAANSCQREIPGPVVRAGGNLSGLQLPSDSAFWRGAYSITRPDCTVAPVGNVQWTFEPTSTIVQLQKQIRLGFRTDSGCIEPSSTAGDSTFTSWPCTATTRTSQRFAMQYDSNGNVQIVNPVNGYCMDGRNVNANETMYWHECHSDLNQRWTPVPVANNAPFVQLKNAKAGTNQCILGDLDTTTLKLATCDGTGANKAQWFTIENVGATVNARYVQFKNQRSNWCMTATGAMNNGRTLTSVDCGAASATRNGFLVMNTGQLRSLDNLSYCVDFHHSGEPDTNLVFWTCHDQGNRDTERSQRWVVPAAAVDPAQSMGSVSRFWDATKCIRETSGQAQPFSVVACVPDADANAGWQRWTLLPVTP